MCVHMSPGTEGVVDAKLVPVLVGKLLKEEDEIKVCTCVCAWPHVVHCQLHRSRWLRNLSCIEVVNLNSAVEANEI